MTDITATAPIKFPAVRAVRLRAPLLGITRGIGILLVAPLLAVGRGFCLLAQAYSEAIALAYMAPWAGPAKRKGPAPEADLQGRDPNW